jgi:hypothetical protein
MHSVPKSLDHSNVTDKEIKNYYSLKPVETDDEDYSFDKQLNKILKEYLETQEFSTDNAKRNFKKRLKKMILSNEQPNSKVYESFISWRASRIQFYKCNVRDLKMNESKTDTEKEKDALIRKLKAELQQTKKQCEIYKKENIELREQLNQNVSVAKQPTLSVSLNDTEEYKVEEVEKTEKTVVKVVSPKDTTTPKPKAKPSKLEMKTEDEVIKFYSRLKNDDERIKVYFNEVEHKKKELISKFKDKLDCDPEEIEDLVGNEFQTFIDLEGAVMEALDNIDKADEYHMFDVQIDDLTDRLEELAENKEV